MILVTGGNGNIGRELCKYLASRGEKVISIGRRYFESEFYKHIQIDVTDKVAKNV